MFDQPALTFLFLGTHSTCMPWSAPCHPNTEVETASPSNIRDRTCDAVATGGGGGDETSDDIFQNLVHSKCKHIMTILLEHLVCWMIVVFVFIWIQLHQYMKLVRCNLVMEPLNFQERMEVELELIGQSFHQVVLSQNNCDS